MAKATKPTKTTKQDQPIFRVRIVYDPDARFEECNGENRPLTAGYERYREYWGDPDRHVYAGVIVDKRCACCGNWDQGVASVWHVDFMDDDAEAAYVGTGKAYTPEEALALPGYLAEVCWEELTEAGYRLSAEHRCKHRGCTYLTVISDPAADRRYCAQHQPKKAK